MTEPAQKRRYTVDEYLRMERDALDKHEFHDGEILAMSGGSANHSQISANLLRAVGNRIQSGPCILYDPNLRVRIQAARRYVYPDATIVCEPLKFDPEDKTGESILNPRLVFEILSPSTEGYDRGDKFSAYRMIPSLEEYILISQEHPRIEVFTRQADGRWLFVPYGDVAGAAKLLSIQLDLPLVEVYARTQFPPRLD